MKNILLLLILITSANLFAQRNITITKGSQSYQVNYLEDIEGLEALESLEGLEGLKGLKALKSLDGLESLAGLASLSNISSDLADLSDLSSLSEHVGFNDCDVDCNHKHKGGTKKEHRINMSSGTLVIDGLDNVSITGYSGSEVIFSRTSDDEEHDKRARGLKAINSLGLDDNTGIGLNATKNGSELNISQVSKSCCDDDLEIQVPHGISLDISNKAIGQGDVEISDIKDEIVISNNYGDISLNNVSGPLAIKTVYGEIEATMNNISSEGSISLYSVYGLLDVTVPASTESDIEISTPYGEIYTDIDIDVSTSSNMKRLSKRKVRGTINGGGIDMTLKSGYKNIYLRKQ